MGHTASATGGVRLGCGRADLVDDTDIAGRLAQEAMHRAEEEREAPAHPGALREDDRVRRVERCSGDNRTGARRRLHPHTLETGAEMRDAVRVLPRVREVDL